MPRRRPNLDCAEHQLMRHAQHQQTGDGVRWSCMGDLYVAALARSSSDSAECADGADDDDAASSEMRRKEMYGGKLEIFSSAARVSAGIAPVQLRTGAFGQRGCGALLVGQ